MEALFLRMDNVSSQTFKLPQPLLEGGGVGTYGCALMQLNFQVTPWPHDAPDLFLCTNFTKEVVLDELSIPVLRQIPWTLPGVSETTFDKLLYLPVVRCPLEEIQLYICNRQGTIPSFKELHLACTLLIIPYPL